MNRINKNAGVIAIICSLISIACLVAILRVEAITLTDNSLEWAIGICVGISSLSISTFIIVQLVNYLTIEKRIEKRITKASQDIEIASKENMRKEIDAHNRSINAVYMLINEIHINYYNGLNRLALIGFFNALEEANKGNSINVVDDIMCYIIKIKDDKECNDIRITHEETIRFLSILSKTDHKKSNEAIDYLLKLTKQETNSANPATIIAQ